MIALLRNLETLLEPVRRELSVIGIFGVDLKPFASGLEFAVFRANWGAIEVVVKTPWQRHINNSNDSDQDARDLLRQEAALLRFARSIGVPAPDVYQLHVDGELDLLVTTLVPNDDSPLDGEQLATALITLHSATPPAIPLVAQPDAFQSVVAERLARRARIIEDISGIALGLPGFDELRSIILATTTTPPSLLHLDIRRENVLVHRGQIVGLIDWTNALIGDRAIELARLAEYGTAPEGFFDAYQRCYPTETDRTLEIIYRLDTVVMLAIVFLSEAPDPEQASLRLIRACTLAGMLRDKLGI